MDPEEPQRLTPAVPEPPRLTYKRPGLKEADQELLRGPRGIQIGIGEARGMGAGWEIASALVSSLLAGILLGLAADRWWIRSATPWGVIAGVLLGSISGFAKMLQLSNRTDQGIGRGSGR